MSLSMLEMCTEKLRTQRCSAEPNCTDVTNGVECVDGFQKDEFGCTLKPCTCTHANRTIAGDVMMSPKLKKNANRPNVNSRAHTPLEPGLASIRLWDQNRHDGKYIVHYKFHTFLDNWMKQMVREERYSNPIEYL